MPQLQLATHALQNPNALFIVMHLAREKVFFLLLSYNRYNSFAEWNKTISAVVIYYFTEISYVATKMFLLLLALFFKLFHLRDILLDPLLMQVKNLLNSTLETALMPDYQKKP